uniref:GG23228 n=1 Tax=Drosophila erecta TaxID=7220 RepID=B3P0C8_DROER
MQHVRTATNRTSFNDCCSFKFSGNIGHISHCKLQLQHRPLQVKSIATGKTITTKQQEMHKLATGFRPGFLESRKNPDGRPKANQMQAEGVSPKRGHMASSCSLSMLIQSGSLGIIRPESIFVKSRFQFRDLRIVVQINRMRYVNDTSVACRFPAWGAQPN